MKINETVNKYFLELLKEVPAENLKDHEATIKTILGSLYCAAWYERDVQAKKDQLTKKIESKLN